LPIVLGRLLNYAYGGKTMSEHLDEYLTVLKSINDDLMGRQIDKFYADAVRDSCQSHLDVFRAGSDFREGQCSVETALGNPLLVL
jgi:hypothetical protein